MIEPVPRGVGVGKAASRCSGLRLGSGEWLGRWRHGGLQRHDRRSRRGGRHVCGRHKWHGPLALPRLDEVDAEFAVDKLPIALLWVGQIAQFALKQHLFSSGGAQCNPKPLGADSHVELPGTRASGQREPKGDVLRALRPVELESACMVSPARHVAHSDCLQVKHPRARRSFAPWPSRAEDRRVAASPCSACAQERASERGGKRGERREGSARSRPLPPPLSVEGHRAV
eukprot:scaffold313112_cov27-Tisochrysis_lutea.AAC.1